MNMRQLWFEEPGRVGLRALPLPDPGTSEVRVKVRCSAISAGTEMLVYRGQLPEGQALDATLASLQRPACYPLPYGYACVGEVERIGTAVEPAWLGKPVFSFQPHASHCIARPEQLLPVPSDIPPEAAVFLANMETAVNLAQDGAPLFGERVVVLGLGIVGLLLSSLLARFPLASLHAVDGIALRRDRARQLGPIHTFDPGSADELASLKQSLRLPVDWAARAASGADLVYEVSGSPDALNLAVDLSGFAGRIVIGSWYGAKAAPLHLGGAAHRHRLRFLTSQVSSIDPNLSGRWDQARRFAAAWDMIRQVRPQDWITHRVPLEEAAGLYQRLDQAPESVLQAVFVY